MTIESFDNDIAKHEELLHEMHGTTRTPKLAIPSVSIVWPVNHCAVSR